MSHKLFAVVPVATLCVSMAVAAADSPKSVFREPFTLKLRVDKEHYYEQKFGKIPYVDDGNVYLFQGDEFGLSLEIKNASVQTVQYQPDLKKANVRLKFTQEVQKDGSVMMLLTIKNRTKYILKTDALMTVPGDKKIRKTSILPVQPGLTGFESWPHPIIQLMLRNIQLVKPETR